MMETVLNVGLCTQDDPRPGQEDGNERFVYDAYRRLITMYSDVVMEKAEGIEPAEGKGIRVQLEQIMDELKEAKGYKTDTDLTADDLKQLCDAVQGQGQGGARQARSPTTPMEQLWGGIGAVFKSWNGKRAVAYRRIEGIPDEWGTAVQRADHGLRQHGRRPRPPAWPSPATRPPARTSSTASGWSTPRARTWWPASARPTRSTKRPRTSRTSTCRRSRTRVARDLQGAATPSATSSRSTTTDMQDIEFTIQEGRLYMLQCRVGKRTGTAALNMAMDMLAEKLIDEATAVMRVGAGPARRAAAPDRRPGGREEAPSRSSRACRPVPAAPAARSSSPPTTPWRGPSRARPSSWSAKRPTPRTSRACARPQGILTARGGMTSHAALVARGWGKCCIVGAGAIEDRR